MGTGPHLNAGRPFRRDGYQAPAIDPPTSKMKLAHLVILGGLVAVFTPAIRAAEAVPSRKVWRSASFLDRVDGTLGDGGANTYVAADGTVRMINVTDLNQDGNIDIVCPTDHDYDQVVPISIFWSKSGFAADRVTRLPANGGRGFAVADLNGDGHADLVVANQDSDPWRPQDVQTTSYIYWGGPEGLSEKRRTELPTQEAVAAAVADIDGDGSLDIVFANIGNTITVDHFRKSFVYWGDRGKFDASRRTILETERASGVQVADVNKDGHPDVLFSMEGDVSATGGMLIYWGGAGREALGRSSAHLPSESSSGLAVADLNGDSYPDVVIANEYHTDRRENFGVYTIDNETKVNSLIYWGSREGLSNKRTTALPTLKAMGVAVADLNGDGMPDIVFANNGGGVGYGAGTSGTYFSRNGGDSYIYWNDRGEFRQNRRSNLPTNNSTGCAIGDLNGDSFPDIVFSNGTGAGSAESNGGAGYNTDSYIYWGGPEGYAEERRAMIPGYGPGGVAVGDLDGDRKPEVLLANLAADPTSGVPRGSYAYWGDGKGGFVESRRQIFPMAMASYSIVDVNADGYADFACYGGNPRVYWGGKDGVQLTNVTSLPTGYSFDCQFADFNRDGYLDCVTSEWHPGSTETSVYYGSMSGFSGPNRFAFKVGGTRMISVADLNRDGWLDAIFTTKDDTQLMLIFWGSPTGFDNARKAALPIRAGTACRVADLNRDGFLDIVAPNVYDPTPPKGAKYHPHAFGGSTQGDTFVYFGGPDGYSAARRQILPSSGGLDCSLADLRKDGYLDIVVTNYSGSPQRDAPAYIFWNGPKGIDGDNPTFLPCFASCSVQCADFDNDGFQDIRLANHVVYGDHGAAKNFIYWGGNDGYSADRRLDVYAPGDHYMTGVDVGNVYDRSDRYDYVSPAFDAGAGSRFEELRWEGDTPFKTGLELQVRTAASRAALEKAPWSGPEGPTSFFRGGRGDIPASVASARWIQYKATLVSPNDANTPVLRGVSVTYR